MAYLTLQQLKDNFLGEWNDDLDSYAENLIEIAEERLKQEFKIAGKNLSEEVENHEVSLVLLRNVLSEMVKRVIQSASLPSGDITNISQSASGYSASYTLANASSAMFIRKDELRQMGLKRTGFLAFNTFSGEVYKNGKIPEEKE